MLISKCTIVDIASDEITEMTEEVTWLLKNGFLMEKIKYEGGVKFYIPNSIFNLWVETFNIRHLDDEPMEVH